MAPLSGKKKKKKGFWKYFTISFFYQSRLAMVTKRRNKINEFFFMPQVQCGSVDWGWRTQVPLRDPSRLMKSNLIHTAMLSSAGRRMHTGQEDSS